MQSTDGDCDGDGDGKANADNGDEADADNDDDAEMIYNIFPPKVLGVSRSTSRGDFMASRKILLLPPNISSTKYFIPSSDQISYAILCEQISHLYGCSKIVGSKKMYKSYNANYVDMASNRCEGLAWSQGVSQRIVCTTRSHSGYVVNYAWYGHRG